MAIDWKQMILTTITVVAIIYVIEYGVCLMTGGSFQMPSTTAVIAAVTAANLGRLRRHRKE